MLPDHELVSQALAGSRTACGELIRRYERLVHAVAWAVLRDHHAAEDVSQSAFLKAFDQLASLRTTHAFAPWLLGIARHAATDLVRGRHRMVAVAALPDTPAADIGPEEDAGLLIAALAQLPDHEQQVIFLHYFSDLPVAAIAAISGCPVGTVTKQLSRGLARLRGILKENP